MILLRNIFQSVYNQLPEALSGGGGWWSPYGGILSTVSDFNTIADMLLHMGNHNGIKLLSKETVETMIGNQVGNLMSKDYRYGLGVGIYHSRYYHVHQLFCKPFF
jgi:hypothetical protein